MEGKVDNSFGLICGVEGGNLHTTHPS